MLRVGPIWPAPLVQNGMSDLTAMNTERGVYCPGEKPKTRSFVRKSDISDCLHPRLPQRETKRRKYSNARYSRGEIAAQIFWRFAIPKLNYYIEIYDRSTGRIGSMIDVTRESITPILERRCAASTRPRKELSHYTFLYYSRNVNPD